MMLNFDSLTIRNNYDRPELARMWGYETYHAISRGVITPKGEKNIILFVTREKQEQLTQYEDHIEQDILFWEGEAKHGSDQRIVERHDTIHFFFRERHHLRFVYEGKAILLNYKLLNNRPSKFTFRLLDRKITEEGIVEEVRMSYELPATMKEAIIKSRRGHGIYRERSIDLWRTCSVTGFTKSSLMIASHIKPWKVSTNIERIDHFNSLLLVPSLDKLFDKGYIGFEHNGKILISDKITSDDLRRIGISADLRFRCCSHETQKYLDYHCEYRFDLLPE